MQSYPFDEFSRDKVPVSVRANLVNGQNVWVIQGRGRARLGFEAAKLYLIRRQMLREKLERDLACEALIARELHFAHPTRAEQRFDLIATNRPTY